MTKIKVLPFTIPKSDKAAIQVQKDKEPKFYGHLHEHPETQLSLILNGRGTLFCGNAVIPYQPYSLVCIYGGQPHLFRSDPEGEGYSERITIFFMDSWLDQLMEITPEMNSLNGLFNQAGTGWYIAEADLALIHPFDRLLQLDSIQRLQGFIEILRRISRFNPTILGDSGVKSNYNKDDSNRMSRIVEYTMNHYQQPIALTEVADKIALTPSSFCKYFKKRTGKSYVQFLNEIRCESARNLLVQDTELSMPQIAEASGFNSIANFNRQFKKYQGMAPRDYRRLKVLPTAGGVSL